MVRVFNIYMCICVCVCAFLWQLDTKACIAALPECEPLVLEHCLRAYCVDGGVEETGTEEVSFASFILMLIGGDDGGSD